MEALEILGAQTEGGKGPFLNQTSPTKSRNPLSEMDPDLDEESVSPLGAQCAPRARFIPRGGQCPPLPRRRLDHHVHD